jgi:hypothetical protein
MSFRHFAKHEKSCPHFRLIEQLQHRVCIRHDALTDGQCVIQSGLRPILDIHRYKMERLNHVVSLDRHVTA